ncbi:transporter substrate-binding domain-containing protein [Shewanella psychropiezotolerans]|uniref:Transporter substrate-binding domain-containing protein n=2 Tax=Shewanellaceae TaxID=267890 RepID=A0ABX5X5R4_9GAMM|nr:transporter substrate-binding domain-containing protein [Shewanella sp. YLB-07]QDO86700.1 transporter substrate-binding domain-containing protein [Shewanella psychropiezotolerans]
MGEDSYPYQFVDEQGEPSGVLVDMWKEWSKQTATPVMFVSRHWTDALDQLADGDADLHIGMAVTQSRSDKFVFAQALTHVSTYLYLHQDLPQRLTFEALGPYQVGIVSGSSHETELLKLSSKMRFKRYKNRHELLEGVLRGEVKVFAGMQGYLRDKKINKQIISLFPLSRRILIKQVPMRPALNKSDTKLLRQVNAGFAAIDKGRFDAIEEHWIGIKRQQNGLTIATTINLEPFISLGGDGMPHGLYVDIWNLWSEKTGIPISFVTSEINQSLDRVKSGKADVHIGYPESDKFKTGLLRSQLLYRVKSRLHNYGKPIDSLQSLQGSRVGAVPTAPYLAALKQALPNVELKLYDSVTAMIQAAREGHIGSFVASSSWTHHYLVLQDAWSEFYPFPELEFVTDIFVLTHPHNVGLSNRIKTGFELIETHELAEIERKWILNSQDRIFDSRLETLQLSGEEQEYLKALKSVKVGYLKDWKPMEFIGGDDIFSGINRDVIDVITKQLGVSVEPVAFDEWQSLIKALTEGEVDIAGSVAENAERRKSLLFSDPYWPSPWSLATPLEREAIFNVQQLAGQRLAIVEGYQLVNQLMGGDYGIELVLVTDPHSGLTAVKDGKADAFVDKAINLASTLKHGDYAQLKMSVLADFSEQHSHFGVHPSLAQFVPLMNLAIKNLDQAKRQAIYQHWIQPVAVPSRESDTIKWCVSVILILLILIAIILMCRLLLAKERLKRTQLESQLSKMTNYDQMTGFANRSLLDDRLKQAVLLHSREQATFGVLFIDIGGLKPVNKEMGHDVGDKLLKLVAEEMSTCIRRSDTLARFGSNEFVVVLNKTKDLDLVCQVADTIIINLSKSFDCEDTKLNVRASIGIAMFPADGDNVVELLKSADKLMYRAKQSGGNCYKSS